MNRLHTSPVQGHVSHPATFHWYKGATITRCHISHWYKTLWDAATSRIGTRHCETPLDLAMVQDIVRHRYMPIAYDTPATFHQDTLCSAATCQCCHSNMPLCLVSPWHTATFTFGVWHTSWHSPTSMMREHQLLLYYTASRTRFTGHTDIHGMVLFTSGHAWIHAYTCHQISPTLIHAKTASNACGKWRTRCVTFCLPTTPDRITKMLQMWKLSDISATITLSSHRIHSHRHSLEVNRGSSELLENDNKTHAQRIPHPAIDLLYSNQREKNPVYGWL